MRRYMQEEEGLFPNFAGFADLMSALCLMFIIVAALILFQYKVQLAALGQVKATNDNLSLDNQKLLEENKKLLAENKLLQKEVEAAPKKFIIPNELNGKVFFRSGEAIIQREFYSSLNGIANDILSEINKGNFNFVQIEGHTDKQPIYTYKYQDNWDLGAARAAAVVRYFITRGIRPEQLSAVSHGEFKPAAYGESSNSYSQNRRIEITLLKK